MKVNIQKIAYRTIPVLTAFVVLLSCVIIPAYAIGDEWSVLDYEDYVISEGIVDGVNSYAVSLPSALCGCQVVDSDGTEYIPGETSGRVYIRAGESASCNFFAPGGYVTKTVFSAKNIPSYSYFSSSVKVTLEDISYGSSIDGYADVRISYHDEDMNLISYQYADRVAFDLEDTEISVSIPSRIVIEKPSNAVYMLFYWVCHLDVVSSSGYAQVLFEYMNTDLYISVESAYILQQQMDAMINGTPGQNAAVGGAVGDMNNAAGELGALGDQLAGVNKPDIDSIDVSIESIVDYPTLVAYAVPIQTLWENPTLLGMLMIVVTLVIVSWVFFGKKV